MLRLVMSLIVLTLSASPGFADRLRFEDSTKTQDSPGGFVYDPIDGNSALNRHSWKVNDGKQALETKLSDAASFTFEAFARPGDGLQTRPKDILPVFATLGGTTQVQVGVYRNRPPHSYNWWRCRILQKGQWPVELARGGYKGISMVGNGCPWRHVAFTWNAETRTAAFYLDYRLQQTARLKQTPGWDLSKLSVGSGGTKPFTGHIDEVRVTRRTLKPWEFLRASNTSLKDVSFAPEREPALPADYGHVDVRLHYGAVGDGVHDDTEAIRRAFAESTNRVPVAYKTVYFPAGTYLITDSIRFSRFMVVRGAGADRTTIRLQNRAKGYDNVDVPKPAFAVGYDWPYVNRPRKNRAGNVIGNYLFDLSINTGSGNPAALGLDFHCNNHGCVENVKITSGDGVGLVGLDLRRPWPGPCLIKNVRIQGFDTGIATGHREYSLVFSGIHLSGQRDVAIHNGGNVLSLENVVSENAVPAVRNRGGGLVVLINSKLRGGNKGTTAITSDNASVYLRNIDIEGYGVALHETRTKKEQPAESIHKDSARHIDEHFTGPFDHAFPTENRGSLKLPIKQTPAIPKPAVSSWVNVNRFADRVTDGDWAPAIQAAIDEGAELLYFPAGGRFPIKSDVVIRGNVTTLLGGSPKMTLGGSGKDAGKGPVVILDSNQSAVQFEMLTPTRVVHRSQTSLVLRHCGAGEVVGKPGCGDLFIEDAGGKWRFNEHQRVWGRQLNPETKGLPEIINRGGQLWVLGLKTEYLSTKIENRAGARTEILGGLMYPVHAVKDESLPMFLNQDSDISLVHGVSVYKKNHKIYIRDTQRGDTREFTEWRWIGDRPIANLYRSSP